MEMQKNLFSVINDLVGKEVGVKLPEYDDDKDLADDFMNYLINKIKHIRSELGHFSKYKPHIDFSKGEVLEEFDTICKMEIQEIVGKLKSTSCKDDPIPSELFKRYIYLLLPLIIKIVNESLKEAKLSKQ